MTQQNETELTDPQREAINLLLMGRSVQEIADTVGCDRSTLWRWKNQPAFQAELNKRRELVWCGQTDRIRNLATMAIEVVEMALDAGDVTTAREVLKGCGLLAAAGAPVGETDPQVIQRQQERDSLFAFL